MIKDQVYTVYLNNQISQLNIENKRLVKLNHTLESQSGDTEIKLNRAIVLLDKIANDPKTNSHWKKLIDGYISRLNQPATMP